MRAAAIAIVSLLTVFALPGVAPDADATEYPFHPFVYLFQNPGDPVPTVFVPDQGVTARWSCDIFDTSGVSADVTVLCDGNYNPLAQGTCSNLMVGAQSRTGYPIADDIQRVLLPVTAPPPVLPNANAGATQFQLDAECGSNSVGVAFMTPDADADTSFQLASSTSFTCTLHIDDAQAATPWNAFCYGF